MSNLIDPFAEGASSHPAPLKAPTPTTKPQLIVGTFEHAKTVVAYVLAVFLGLLGLACVVILVEAYLAGGGDTPINPTSDFVSLGRTYRDDLAAVYATAWTDGAKVLEAGQPPKTALDTVAASWDSGRVKLFEAKLSPAFDKVVKEGKDDVGRDERERLAAAWRSFAKGLAGADH